MFLEVDAKYQHNQNPSCLGICTTNRSIPARKRGSEYLSSSSDEDKENKSPHTRNDANSNSRAPDIGPKSARKNLNEDFDFIPRKRSKTSDFNKNLDSPIPDFKKKSAEKNVNSPIPVSNKKPTKQGFNFPTPDSKKKLTNKNFDFLALNSAKSEVMSDTNDFDYLPYRRPNVKTNYNQKNKSDAKSDPKTPIVTPRLKTLDSSDSRTPRVTLRDGGTNLAKDVKACIICGVINEDLYDQSKMTVTRILFPVRS